MQPLIHSHNEYDFKIVDKLDETKINNTGCSATYFPPEAVYYQFGNSAGCKFFYKFEKFAFAYKNHAALCLTHPDLVPKIYNLAYDERYGYGYAVEHVEVCENFPYPYKRMILEHQDMKDFHKQCADAGYGCDWHFGNFGFRADNKLVLVDFGAESKS